MLKQWQIAFRQPGFVRRVVATVLFLTAASVLFANFVPFIEHRAGVVLPDPILSLLPRADLGVLIFATVYTSVAVAVFNLARSPNQLLFALQVYGGMFVVRTMAMYVTPLAPPPSMVLLRDPVAAVIFGSHVAPTHDLFFSGHTATLFILFLTAEGRWLRAAFLAGTVIVGVAVLIQGAHYTTDVLAAPFFVYGVYVLARRLQPQSTSDEVVSRVEGTDEVAAFEQRGGGGD